MARWLVILFKTASVNAASTLVMLCVAVHFPLYGIKLELHVTWDPAQSQSHFEVLRRLREQTVCEVTQGDDELEVRRR